MKGSVWAAFTGLALLAAMRAEAQQAPDPIAAAGLLQGQCQAIDPSVAVSCGKLSGAVANGHDPSAVPRVAGEYPDAVIVDFGGEKLLQARRFQPIGQKPSPCNWPQKFLETALRRR